MTYSSETPKTTSPTNKHKVYRALRLIPKLNVSVAQSTIVQNVPQKVPETGLGHDLIRCEDVHLEQTQVVVTKTLLVGRSLFNDNFEYLNNSNCELNCFCCHLRTRTSSIDTSRDFSDDEVASKKEEDIIIMGEGDD
ncbi:hypothetical protein quinque_010861 [Culex quinquefasciatus]